MRLKESILLWIIPAVVLPLVVLGAVAATWMEQRHLENVDQDISASLASLVLNLERRLRIERDIAGGLAEVPQVRQFLPVLEYLYRGEVHRQAARRYESLQGFFEVFQSVRTSLNTIRVLDDSGNTLIKVRSGKRVPGDYEGFGDLPYVEEDPGEPWFSRMLTGLHVDQTGSLLLPYSDNGLAGTRRAVYNTAMPLRVDGRILGYLSINPPLGPLNRILDLATRPHGGSLLLAEVDSAADRSRDGLILYDDERAIDLLQSSDASTLKRVHPGVYDSTFVTSQGVMTEEDGRMRVYYQEFQPYPDRLTGWVIALRVPSDNLTLPFRDIRIAIVASIVTALLLSFFLTGAAARQIAEPLLNLAQGLTRFANSPDDVRLVPKGPVEIRNAGEAFNVMTNSLKAAQQARDDALAAQYRSSRLASLGQVAGGIAHEISNPINTIVSLTTLIERELQPHDDGIRADVASIREEAVRAAGTIHAILNFSGDIDGEVNRFEVAEWIEDSMELVADEARARSIVIEAGTTCDCVIQGNRPLLQRALRNLLENAIHASSVGSTVTVESQRLGDSVCVAVIDEGEGMSPEQAERVFDPFYTTKSAGQGSGLGLSISLGIVQHHGGSLTLQNREPVGVVARITLPVAADV